MRDTFTALRDDAQLAAYKVFGCEVALEPLPGGSGRPVLTGEVDGDHYVWVRRNSLRDAERETRILSALDASDATPRLLGASGQWIIQQFVERTRLPVVLESARSNQDAEQHVTSALNALQHIHCIAAEARLERIASPIGGTMSWLSARLGMINRSAVAVGCPTLQWREQHAARYVALPRTSFIKYDARPGNALWASGNAVWIDWEDCGVGLALEDLVFVLCDEWCSLDAASEATLIDTFLPRFSGSLDEPDARFALRFYGTVHMASRIAVILKAHEENDGFFDRGLALWSDKPGNTSLELLRIARRGRSWASRLPGFDSAASWFDQIGKFAVGKNACGR